MVLSVLTGESALLGDQLTPGGIWVWITMAQDQLHAQMETGKKPSISLKQNLSRSSFKDKRYTIERQGQTSSAMSLQALWERNLSDKEEETDGKRKNGT